MRRVVLVFLASFIFVPAAHASVTYDVDVEVLDEQQRLVGSFKGTLRYDGPAKYRAHVCVTDELADNRAPFFNLEYLYADGTRHLTRRWRQTGSAGSTKCYDSWVEWPPAIDAIWIRATVDKRSTPVSDFYDNPYVVAPPPPEQVDADRDGFSAAQDCNDADPAIRPGALEIRGNAVDENCDGVAEELAAIDSGVSSVWVVRGRSVTVRRLRVRGVPAGAKVRFRCLGRRCPDARRVRVRRGRANVRAQLPRRRFRAGQTLELRITAAGRIGKIVRYPLVRGRPPTAKVLCLAPGARRPARCG